MFFVLTPSFDTSNHFARENSDDSSMHSEKFSQLWSFLCFTHICYITSKKNLPTCFAFAPTLKVSSKIHLNQKAEYWLSDGCAAMLSCPQLASSAISILWAIHAPAINISGMNIEKYTTTAEPIFLLGPNIILLVGRNSWKYRMEKQQKACLVLVLHTLY